MMVKHSSRLNPNLTPGAQIVENQAGIIRLEIPSGADGRYRLSQLDDYSDLHRKAFPWRSPIHLSLQSRVSSASIPGTWGFGFWNDPFSMDLRGGRDRLRMPVLPNAAWFFFASPANYLSLRDDIPGNGFLAATFSTQKWASALIYPGIIALPLMFLPLSFRFLRRLASRIVSQDSFRIIVDTTEWHRYEISIKQQRVEFQLDSDLVFETSIVPQGRLGFLMWVDNRFLAFSPDGRFSFGTAANPDPAWIEVGDLVIEG